jgi:outer membrane protein
VRRLLARIAVATLLGGSLAFAFQAQANPPGLETPLGKLLSDARRMLTDGEPTAAYALLESRSALYAGSVDFDTLLGIAALDSGRPGSAVIALERVLAAEPSNLPVRAEIGRAYLQLKELESARRELESVATGDLPPQVRQTVSRYLDTVARLERLGRPQWLFTLETNVGWDDNVNFGSSVGVWTLADGQSLLPLPVSKPRSSGFLSLAAGAQYIVPIGGQVEWTAGFLGAQRTNPSQHNMDMGSLELSSGLSYSMGLHRYSMSLQYQHLRLDEAALRNATGIIGQWQYDVGRRSQIGAYLQGFDLAFPDQPVRDARRASAGATFAHGFLSAGLPVLAASLQAGSERPRDDFPQLSFRFAGVRTALGATIGSGWRASGGWSFERRDFDGPEPLFGATRKDRQHDFRLAIEHDLDKNLTLSPTLLHTRNNSTIAPNEFRRTQAYLYARYRF